jgi:hypothetical protein
MLERSLRHFPELKDRTITIGYTRRHLGSATLRFRARAAEPQLIIRLKVRKLTYQTIGHELIHLVQGLAHGVGTGKAPSANGRIPSGEKACDIWTLARHDLFCDDAPTYLRVPHAIREQWPLYSAAVRKLCTAAIEKRQDHRLYIRWLESELRRLPRRSAAEKKSGEQLELALT